MRDDGCQIKVVSLGFATFLGRSWGHPSACSIRLVPRRASRCRAPGYGVKLNPPAKVASPSLVVVHGLEGGTQNSWISWIDVRASSGGKAHRAVHE